MLRTCVALGCLALVFGAPARAVELSASSAASSASESVSTSVGSLSNSVTGSSRSSTGDDQKTAEGEYRVRAVAALAERPGFVRVTLQNLARPGADGELNLTLPQVTAERARLATGGTVHVKPRPFGLEFAQGPAREAFFLAVADDWLRDLAARPVAL